MPREQAGGSRSVKRSLPQEDSYPKKKMRELKDDIMSRIPHGIDIMRYTQSRAIEIASLSASVSQIPSKRLPQQKLPRHMQRRAMSHNVKRFPRRLRESVKKMEMYVLQEGLPKSKRPSRKHRRKPKNLLEAYNRRKRKHAWLETHIWHAKRFHMVNKWGYRLPVNPTEKADRPTYRACKEYCLLQDVSFLSCLQISGPEQDILTGLSQITDTDADVTFADEKYLSGAREGQTFLYEVNKFPKSAVGLISFMWRPHISLETDETKKHNRDLWIWCHPVTNDSICHLIADCFSETKTPTKYDGSSSQDVLKENSTKDTADSVDKNVADSVVKDVADSVVKDVVDNVVKDIADSVAKDIADSVAKDIADSVAKDIADSVAKDIADSVAKDIADSVAKDIADSVKNVTDNQNIIKHVVVKDKTDSVDNDTAHTNTFHVKLGNVQIQSFKDHLVRFRLTGPLSQSILADAIHIADILPSDETKDKWWQSYFEDQSASLCCTQQREIWESFKKVSSPAQFSSNMVIGLTVSDPRLTRPEKKSKVTPEGKDLLMCEDMPAPELASSPLWQQGVREEVTRTKMADSKINELRSEQLIPGSCLELGPEEDKIPIILIQNPGISQMPANSTNEPCGGFGNGWDIVLPQEWGMPFWISFVYHGSRVGGLKASDMVSFEQGKLKFPVDSPDSLFGVQEENDVFEEMREKYFRRPPAKRLNFMKLGIKCPFYCPWTILVNDWIQERKKSFAENELSEDGVESVNSTMNENIIVLRSQKILKMLNEFCLQKFTSIPNSEIEVITPQTVHENDITELVSTNLSALVPVRITLLSRGTAGMFSHLCIPANEDLEKLAGDQMFAGPIEGPHIDPTKLSRKQRKNLTKKARKKAKMCEQDLYKQNVTDIMKHCSRQTIGFIKYGGYSMRRGGGVGLGFCSLVGLVYLLQTVNRCLILVRNSDSDQYRFASLEVVT